MELGFNFQTRKVEVMPEYKVFNIFFDYEKDFLDESLAAGADNLEKLFTEVVNKFEDGNNYHIMLYIDNAKLLDYDEYFTIFSSFAFVLAHAKKAVNNKQGYLKVKEDLKNSVICTDYTLLKFMNNDYPYGLIQLSLEDKEGAVVQWAH